MEPPTTQSPRLDILCQLSRLPFPKLHFNQLEGLSSKHLSVCPTQLLLEGNPEHSMSYSRKVPREVLGGFWNLLWSLPSPLRPVLTCLSYTMYQKLDMPVHLAHRTSSIRTAARSHVQGRPRPLQGNLGKCLAPMGKV